jgi:hypothetical protein
MNQRPSPTESNGPEIPTRGPNGRFLPGNRLAKGNPAARRAQSLRFALLRAVKPSDLTQIVEKLIQLAIGGDVQAAKLVLDRVLGPLVPIDIEERLTRLEQIKEWP